MFDLGTTIIYPMHGVSRVSKIYKESFNGKEISYYELEFTDGVTIDVPVSQAAKLGMRAPVSKKELMSELAKLKEEYTPDEETAADTRGVIKTLQASGSLADAVKLLQLIRWISREKQAKSKKLEIDERDSLEKVKTMIRSEMSIILGREQALEYML